MGEQWAWWRWRAGKGTYADDVKDKNTRRQTIDFSFIFVFFSSDEMDVETHLPVNPMKYGTHLNQIQLISILYQNVCNQFI